MDISSPAKRICPPISIGESSPDNPPAPPGVPSFHVARAYTKFADRLLDRVRRRLPPALIGRTDPEDVVQSVFRRLIAHYGTDGYSVAPGHELWKLLSTIAANKIRDEDAYHRALRRDVRRTRSSASISLAEFGEAAGDVSLRLVIGELIAPLPPDRRAAVELRLDGYGFTEIAAKVGRSKRTVERYLQEFRDRLEATLARTLT